MMAIEFFNLGKRDQQEVFNEIFRQKIMQEQMIYGNSLPFDQLLLKLKDFKEKISQLDWEIKL